MTRTSHTRIALFSGLLGCSAAPPEDVAVTDICPQVDLIQPACRPPDLDIPPPTESQNFCWQHTDCEPDQFCIDNSCRIADEQYVTICLERAYYSGQAPRAKGTPPNFSALLTNRDAGPVDPLLFVEAPSDGAQCNPRWSHCELFYLGGTDTTYLALVDGANNDALEIVIADFAGTPAVTLGRMANRGCQEFSATFPEFTPEATATMWISVWSWTPDPPSPYP